MNPGVGENSTAISSIERFHGMREDRGACRLLADEPRLMGVTNV